MGVVSNKVDITELQKSGGGGGGDLDGRVSALELESAELAEGLALVQTSVNSGLVPMQTGNKISFGVDGSGNYGYYKAGADTVTPFLSGRPFKQISISITEPYNIRLSNVDIDPKIIILSYNTSASANELHNKITFVRLGQSTSGTYSGYVCYGDSSGNIYYKLTPGGTGSPPTFQITYDATSQELTITSTNQSYQFQNDYYLIYIIS